MRRLFERNVYDEYKLYSEQRFSLGNYEGFSSQNKHYFFVCVDDIEDVELHEMIRMGNHHQAFGDYELATFVPTVSNGLVSFIEGQNCVLFQLPQYVMRNKQERTLGQELAEFHQRGKSYVKDNKSSENTWTEFWIKRLEHLENLYGNITKKTIKTSFDQAFIIALPYYLGRTENAIQYIVDTEMDLGIQLKSEPKTTCHYQFSPRTWLIIDHKTQATVKNPIDFMYDHPSRDLAEMTRFIAQHENASFKKIKQFFHDYEQKEKITPQAWRYIYGRLLFPIDFFKIVEGYYRNGNEEKYIDQLYDLMAEEESVESFLRFFQKEVVPKHWIGYVPTVDWLTNQPLQQKVNTRYY